MRISVSNNHSPIQQNSTKYEYHLNQNNSNDSFILTTQNKTTDTEQVAFKGLLSRIFKKKEEEQKPFVIPSPYILSLQEGIKEVFKEDIPAANFSSIMSAKEFKEELKNYKIQDFDINNENVEEGNVLYCADLDSASTFSVGKTDIYTLLEQVAKTADRYYKKTGKKFTFALTDRDTVEGVQQAVRIVAAEPEKFQNLNFIPAMKMTFTHKVPSKKTYQRYENSEMLIYGINPFSPKLVKSVKKRLEEREKMTIAFIQAVNKLYPQFGYTVREFAEQNRINYQKDFGVSNLYWRVREYIETKGDIEIRGIRLSAEEIKKETIQILNEMYLIEQGSENRNISALGTTLVKDDENINQTIKNIFKENRTHEESVVQEDGSTVIEVKSSAENTIEEMMNLFDSEETRPVMAIAAPFYLSHYFKDTSTKTFDKVIDFIADLQEQSKGANPNNEPMLIAFESKAPKYRLDDKLFKRPTANDFPNDDPSEFNPNNPKFFMLKEEPILETFNDYLRNSDKIDLYEVGGSWHDPYRDKFTI